MSRYKLSVEEIQASMMSLPPMMFVPRDDPEWDAMWGTLGRMPYNRLQRQPTACEDEQGEAWQYMGSYAHDGAWVHEFRHRNHPATGKREYARIPATLSFRAAPLVQ